MIVVLVITQLGMTASITVESGDDSGCPTILHELRTEAVVDDGGVKIYALQGEPLEMVLWQSTTCWCYCRLLGNRSGVIQLFGIFVLLRENAEKRAF